MTITLLRGDARRLPLADASVDLIVTSPPYWALRSYTDGGEHYEGQIGSEPTPAEYIEGLIDCTREWMRVLKSTGSMFVNLGDKYGRPGGGADVNPRSLPGAGRGTTGRRKTIADSGTRDKCLLLLPERYRIACVDQLGLIARAVVIRSKPNGLPESVTDRVRRSHEDWVHLTKEPRYFAAVDAVREPQATVVTASGSVRYRKPGEEIPFREKTVTGNNRYTATGMTGDIKSPTGNPLGKLPGSVREVATQPLKVPAGLGVDHFAAFPMEWPRWIITGWSPSGVCAACGEARRLIVQRERAVGMDVAGPIWSRAGRHSNVTGRRHDERSTHAITGEICACPDSSASTRPAVVLDPFGGTGTTALAAHALGRHGISVDMSADYCRLAAWRTSDSGQIAAAMQVEKPSLELDGQLELIGRAS